MTAELVVRGLRPEPVDATWTSPRRTLAEMRAEREQFSRTVLEDRERLARLQAAIDRAVSARGYEPRLASEKPPQ
jgi:hypothetical protein